MSADSPYPMASRPNHSLASEGGRSALSCLSNQRPRKVAAQRVRGGRAFGYLEEAQRGLPWTMSQVLTTQLPTAATMPTLPQPRIKVTHEEE